MRTLKDVEAYLDKLGRRHDPVEGESATFLVQSNGEMPPIAVRVDSPLVVARTYIGEAPKDDALSLQLFRKLLDLNARALVHSSYGLEGNQIVLSSALELENLDFNELEATLDEIDLALAQQVPELLELSKKN
ncbi:MAG: hypothetical protein ABI551_17525 [Polyangiaceae bacterium]